MPWRPALVLQPGLARPSIGDGEALGAPVVLLVIAGASVALGYVPAALQHAESGFEIEILGERRPAKIQPLPLYDPQGGKMRG